MFSFNRFAAAAAGLALGALAAFTPAKAQDPASKVNILIMSEDIDTDTVRVATACSTVSC